MKKVSMTIVLCLAIALCLPLMSGCETTDVLKIALDIEDEGRYNELFDIFTAETGIEIKATYGQDIGKLIGTKNEPDIIKTSTTVVSAMKSSLMSLNSFIQADSEIDTANYIDSVMAALTIENEVYALPTSINTSLLYYNKDMFDKNADALRKALNLSATESVYPQANWTWDDFTKAGVALSKYTEDANGKRTYTQFGCESQINWWGEWLVYVNQMGGSFYEEGSNNHRSGLTSEEAKAGIEFFRKKSKGNKAEKFAPNAEELNFSFASGKYNDKTQSFPVGATAMILGGHTGDWFSYEALGLNWDMQLLPTPVGKPNAKGGEISADAFGISVRSKKKNDAFKFLKMWAGEQGALKMYKYNKIGALKNMEELISALPESEKKPYNISVVFDAIERAVTLPNEMDFSKVCSQIVSGELYNLMLVTGRDATDDVNKVVNTIKTKVDKYYTNLYGNN